MTRTDDGSPCKLAVFNPVSGTKCLFVDENTLYSQWDSSSSSEDDGNGSDSSVHTDDMEIVGLYE